MTDNIYYNSAITSGGGMLFNLEQAKNPETLPLFMNNTIITTGQDGKEVRSTFFGKEANSLYADLSVKTAPVIQP